MSTHKRGVMMAGSVLSAAALAMSLASPATGAALQQAPVVSEVRAKGQAIVEITSQGQIDQLKANSNTTPVIFLITAPAWCGPCQQLDPIIKAQANRDGGKWTLAILDVDKVKPLAGQFGARSYPTLVPFVNGRESGSPKRSVGGFDASGMSRYADQLVRSVGGGGGTQPQPQPTVKPTPQPTVNPNPGTPNPQPTGNPNPGAPGKAPTTPITITDKNYDDFIKSSFNYPVVLDFSKDGCDPCAKLAPVLDEKLKADNGKWALGTLDGTAYRDLWAKYQNPWFPTLIVIKDGKEITRRSGYDGDKAAVIKWLDDAFNGQAQPEDPRVMDVKTKADWLKLVEISKRHPVAIRLNYDKFMDTDKAARERLAGMAQNDGGKWTLANVDVMSPGGMWFAQRNKLMQWPALVVFYNGKVRTEAEVKPLIGKNRTEEEQRTWVNAMLSFKYPVDGDGGAKPVPADPSQPMPTTPGANPTKPVGHTNNSTCIGKCGSSALDPNSWYNQMKNQTGNNGNNGGCGGNTGGIGGSCGGNTGGVGGSCGGNTGGVGGSCGGARPNTGVKPGAGNTNPGNCAGGACPASELLKG